MQLFKAELKCWNMADDHEDTEIVIGFSNTLGDFATRVDKTFNYVDEVKITVINPMTCDTELLYLTSLNSATIASIEKENDY